MICYNPLYQRIYMNLLYFLFLRHSSMRFSVWPCFDTPGAHVYSSADTHVAESVGEATGTTDTGDVHVQSGSSWEQCWERCLLAHCMEVFLLFMGLLLSTVSLLLLLLLLLMLLLLLLLLLPLFRLGLKRFHLKWCVYIKIYYAGTSYRIHIQFLKSFEIFNG